MAVIAVTGGTGAPGATTSALALLLAWPLADGRKLILVECDPDGGAALAGALEGRVEAVYGLRNLAVADRRGMLAEALWDQLIDVSPKGQGERLLLPGLTDPAQAVGLAYTWEPLVEALHALEPAGYDVLLDLGRNGATGTGAVLARRADVVVATVRSTLRGLSSARPRLAALREDLESAGTGADGLGILVVAEGPYPAPDVSRQLGLPVFGVLPFAPRTARVLSDGGDSTDRRFLRSELMRTARTTADKVLEAVARRREVLDPRPARPAEPRPEQSAAQQQAGGYQESRLREAQPPLDQPQAWGAPQQGGYPAAGAAWGHQQAYAPPSGQVYEPPAQGAAPAYQGATTYQQTAYQQPEFQQSQVQQQPVKQPEYQGYRSPTGPTRPAEPAAAETAVSANSAASAASAGTASDGGQAFASPVGQVFVPQTGPVQVRPGAAQPPLAGIAPHPAAPEPFPAPAPDNETQGEVLRAR
ncbi:hypothetical protein [Streptomyces tateyamensis]|uniref:hypothetical protein n=1 Tax=Streptomyces tateyamensis TaxID=565073 RepID=UPI0015E8B3E5|nr:hypothetical protein [Streptomyces tateyamensis]